MNLMYYWFSHRNVKSKKMAVINNDIKITFKFSNN